MNDTFRVFDLHTGTSVFQWQGSLLSRTPTQITSVRCAYPPFQLELNDMFLLLRCLPIRDNIIVQYEHRSISVYAPRLQFVAFAAPHSRSWLKLKHKLLIYVELVL
jgi:hypothetical protein